MQVGLGPQVNSLEYAGEIRARVESQLGFRVAGKIISRAVGPGQRVKAGQVLARLDPQDYDLAVGAARAQRAAALTQRDLALADVRRYVELKAQGFISGAELERRESAFQSAQAQLDQAQAQLAVQANQASYSALTANAPGIVTAAQAEVGQVVTAGAPVLSIAVDGPRDAVFAVAEDQIGRFTLGQTLQAKVWGQAQVLTGQVRELSAAADPMTRTFTVKLALDAVQDRAPALGATVQVRAPSDAPQRVDALIKLPTSALRQDGSATAVWLFDSNSMTVRSQPVQVATMDGNEAVIASGLAPGSLVVSTGVHVLSPGQKVTVYGAPGLGTAAAPSQSASGK
jgi:membrane fusion protein, multidrug efflux system